MNRKRLKIILVIAGVLLLAVAVFIFWPQIRSSALGGMITPRVTKSAMVTGQSAKGMIKAASVTTDGFADIPDVSAVEDWHYWYVYAGVQNNIAFVHPDGMYDPDSLVARNQAVVEIMRTFNLPHCKSDYDTAATQDPASDWITGCPLKQTFRDVPTNDWSWGYIQSALDAGIISKTYKGESGYFGLTETVTLGDFQGWLTKALGKPLATPLKYVGSTMATSNVSRAQAVAMLTWNKDKNIAVRFSGIFADDNQEHEDLLVGSKIDISVDSSPLCSTTAAPRGNGWVYVHYQTDCSFSMQSFMKTKAGSVYVVEVTPPVGSGYGDLFTSNSYINKIFNSITFDKLVWEGQRKITGNILVPPECYENFSECADAYVRMLKNLGADQSQKEIDKLSSVRGFYEFIRDDIIGGSVYVKDTTGNEIGEDSDLKIEGDFSTGYTFSYEIPIKSDIKSAASYNVTLHSVWSNEKFATEEVKFSAGQAEAEQDITWRTLVEALKIQVVDESTGLPVPDTLITEQFDSQELKDLPPLVNITQATTDQDGIAYLVGVNDPNEVKQFPNLATFTIESPAYMGIPKSGQVIDLNGCLAEYKLIELSPGS